MEDTKKTAKEEVDNGRHEISKENKPPRKVIYFANGESMEECNSEDDDAEEGNQKPLLDNANLSWSNYLRLWVLRLTAIAFFSCEFLGGKFATFLGLNESKYQYAVDEYYRTQKKESESCEDGEETSEIKGTTEYNEKYHLEMQHLRYGSLDYKERPVLSQDDTVIHVNELEDDDLQGLNES